MQSNADKQPCLTNAWIIILKFLEKLSIFYFIRKILLPKYTSGNHRFVDGWIIAHNILAIVYVVVASIGSVPLWIKYTLLIYGFLRMFEIFIYQLNVILVHQYENTNHSIHSYRRMTIALLHNFFEIVFWFAGTYITLQLLTTNNGLQAVYQSFTNMVTYSIEIEESKWSLIAALILQFQALIGIFMTLLSLSRFISLLPQPVSMDGFEKDQNEKWQTELKEQLNVLQIKNEEIIDQNRKIIEELKLKEFS